MKRGLIGILALLFFAACGGEEENIDAPSTADFEKERAELAAKIKSKGRDLGGMRKQNKPTPGRLDATDFAVVDKEYTYESKGKRDPFRENRAFIGNAIVVGVFQDKDSAIAKRRKT